MGRLFLIVTCLAASVSCAKPGALGALERHPLEGPPAAILNAPATIQRGAPFDIELAITGHPRNQNLQRPIAVVLSLIDGRSATSIVEWGEPRVGRYFKWEINGRFTQELRSDILIVHVALHHLKGYNLLTGQPILTEHFLRAAKVVTVRHPVTQLGFTPELAE